MKKQTWKKLSALLLAGVVAFSAFSCGGKGGETEPAGESKSDVKDYSDEIDVVKNAPEYKLPNLVAEAPNHLTERPVYALDENATEDDMRDMVIEAMEDLLTFNWVPITDFHYNKTTNGSPRDYDFFPYISYGGVPYTEAAVGIFHMLEDYDYATGYIYGSPNYTNAGKQIGNSCAACVNWAEVSVCPNVTAVSTSDLTPSYGYEKIGPYEYPATIVQYSEYQSTADIIAMSDPDTFYESLALVKKADAFAKVGLPGGGDHVMMAYQDAKVVRDENNKIIPTESEIHIIDQWASEYNYEVNGATQSIRGRIDKVFTFDYFLKNGFLPVRPVDFSKPYVKATCSLDKEVTSLEELKKASVLTNYRTVKIETAIISESGNTVYVKKNLTTRGQYARRDDMKMSARTIIPGSDALEVMRTDRTYTLQVRALVSTGELLVAAEFPISVDDFK